MSAPATERRLLAGNWKMNFDLEAAVRLTEQLRDGLPSEGPPVVVCAPSVFLQSVAQVARGNPRLEVGGQDVSRHASGAHTGEVSAAQLRSVGCGYAIVGHSERRTDHAEAGASLGEKVDRALEHDVVPIYCFGETLAQRDAGEVESVVAEQLSEGLAQLEGGGLSRVVLAYEPVWAIGTGRTASPSQAQEVHAFVRGWLSDRFGQVLAGGTTILYGGSVKPGSAGDLFAQPDIDGGLVGGASLKAEDFLAIAAAF